MEKYPNSMEGFVRSENIELVNFPAMFDDTGGYSYIIHGWKTDKSMPKQGLWSEACWWIIIDSPYRCLSNDAVRRTIRVSATKLLALKMAMHLAREAWSWSTRSSQEVPRALGLALHITAYLHIPTYTFKYRCVCVYIHRKYMYPYRPTYIFIYIHTIPYH